MFWRSIVLGLLIAVPTGPVGVLCVWRTIRYGRTAGFVSGIGSALADALYMTIVAFGLTYISHFIGDHYWWFRAIGGVLILFFGIKTYWSKPETQVEGERKTWAQDLISTFGLTITNPTLVLSFTVLLTLFGIHPERGNYVGVGLAVLGVLAGSLLWWFLLSAVVDSMRSYFVRAERLMLFNKIAGALILVLGALAIFAFK